MEVITLNLILLLAAALFLPASTTGQQLPASETTALFQLQKLLEYPETLQAWNNWTNFCYLPYSTSLKIACVENHITELTILGNRTITLSPNFSIDSLFTTLTKLYRLKTLSVVSLGIWGQLPEKINRFWSLEVLNVSSNFIRGEIPRSIVSMKTLKSIVLADNLFNGSVPDLRRLTDLRELDLGDNRINGSEFPSLSVKLVSIILKNNSFRSVIPSGLGNFNRLEKLDLSYNKFIGPIPSFLFNLPSITYLNLAANKLSGAVPTRTSCSAPLEFVDISHNLLIGKLPSCIGKSTTVNSTWNCLSSGNTKLQFPYSHCHKEALAVKPPFGTQKNKSGIHLGLILGIIGGIIGMVVGIVVLILIIIRKSVKTDKDDDKFDIRSVASKRSIRSVQKPPVVEPRRVPQRMRSAMVGLPPYRVFTLEEIEEATNNFDPINFFEEDAQGQLYKACLSDGTTVQVKCLKVKHKNLSQSLMQHMDVISKLRHRHVVSLLGHCIATYQDHSNTAATVFIVLESISNGSLRDYLTDTRKKESLIWPQRMAITIGTARGIQFLHTGVAPGIFGNNVKIENILLDDTLSAKLSGWTIPLPYKVGNESPMTGQISDEQAEKEDIYQLGVILLKVITGRMVISPGELNELRLQLERDLVEGPSELSKVTDTTVRGTYAYDSLKTTIEVAVNCLSDDLSKRPSIEDVLWNLQYSIQVQEEWTSSGNLGNPS